MAKGMGETGKAQENNFTLNGSKELGVEVNFPELARDLPRRERSAAGAI